MSEVNPFSLAINDDDLADLKTRLSLTRLPEAEPVDDWTQGIPLSYVRELVDYWENEYDGRRIEAFLNRYPQFTTEIDGVTVHFLHVRSSIESARPLVITHGWPGSVIEFSKVIEKLTDPLAHGGNEQDAFHLVLPTIPGYGFSGKPTETGWGVERVARAWSTLMLRLGYERYLAQGGDWGAAITASIGVQDPEHCMGLHTNMPIVAPSGDLLENLTEQELDALKAQQFYQDWDSGIRNNRAPVRRHSAIHSSTRPRARRPGSSRSSTNGRTVTDIRKTS